MEPEIRLALDHASTPTILPETEKQTISRHQQMDPLSASLSPPLKPDMPKWKVTHPLTLCPVTRKRSADFAASDKLKDKKVMNLRPRKAKQAQQSRKKKPQPIEESEPYKKHSKPDEPNPTQQSQRKETTAKKIEEQKKEIMEKKWNEMFQKLIDYKEAHNGSLDIPDSKEATSISMTEKLGSEEKETGKLRRWCEEQKRLHLKWVQDQNSSGVFTQQKYEKLKEAGFEFPEPRWDEQYKKLKAYKDTHGTLKVDRKHDLSLYRWSVRQRNILGKHFEGKPVHISQERLKKLSILGWEKASNKRSKVRDPANEEKKFEEKFQEVSLFRLIRMHQSCLGQFL